MTRLSVVDLGARRHEASLAIGATVGAVVIGSVLTLVSILLVRGVNCEYGAPLPIGERCGGVIVSGPVTFSPTLFVIDIAITAAGVYALSRWSGLLGVSLATLAASVYLGAVFVAVAQAGSYPAGQFGLPLALVGGATDPLILWIDTMFWSAVIAGVVPLLRRVARGRSHLEALHVPRLQVEMVTAGRPLRLDDSDDRRRAMRRQIGWLAVGALAGAVVIQFLITEFSRGAPRPDGTFGAPVAIGAVDLDDLGALLLGQPSTTSLSLAALALNLVATAAPLFVFGLLAGRSALIATAAGGTLGVLESMAQYENVRRTSSLLLDRPFSEVGALWVNALIGMALVGMLWSGIRQVMRVSPAARALVRRLLGVAG